MALAQQPVLAPSSNGTAFVRGIWRRRRGEVSLPAFTLIELLLVMAMLVVVLGVSFPTLQNFFKGRNLDAETQRLVSLTRYGRSRAVSEGIPMVLWIDSRGKRYGLQAQTGYLYSDEKAVSYALDPDLEIEAELALADRRAQWKPSVPGLGNVPIIRFLPDGFLGETSPERIVLRQGQSSQIWIVQNSNRLSYAIESNPSRP